MKRIRISKKLCCAVVIGILSLSACTKEQDPIALFERGDYAEAYQLLLPQATGGDHRAQNYLGIYYYLGYGVKKDYSKALQWYEAAARGGNPNAQRNYGDMLYYGRGIDKDIANAYKWYFAAYQQGNKKAGSKIEVIAAAGNLSPNQQMYAKIAANEFILDEKKRFMSHDTYIQKKDSAIQKNHELQ